MGEANHNPCDAWNPRMDALGAKRGIRVELEALLPDPESALAPYRIQGATTMPKIEGFRVRNFRALRDVTMGKLWNLQKVQPLTPMTVVIGKNGAGKSSLFDAFGFLADCLRDGVEDACDAQGRGGLERLRSVGQTGPIEFEVYYREELKSRPITYELTIDLDSNGRPYVVMERLRQRRKGASTGRPFSFLFLKEGKGVAWKGDAEGTSLEDTSGDEDLAQLLAKLMGSAEESAETETVELSDHRKLGIATLGALKQHPRIAKFREFIEGWYLSYFTPDAARKPSLNGAQKHLNMHGDNLSNVVQFMEREHKQDRFQRILNSIAEKIPGIESIATRPSPDGQLYLEFRQHGFNEPLYSRQMSDGTLKVFAYLLMLEDPNPPPFICIEEPENGLYHRLLDALATEFRHHAESHRHRSQVFITTHQPYLVDALNPEEVWILTKGDDGFSQLRRASDDPLVVNMVAEGLPLGGLWFSDYLEKA